ncbi:MAG: response regulator [Oscillospiraceae bacterium]
MDRYTIEEIFACNAGLSADEMEALADFAGVGLFNLHTDSGQIELNRNITLLTGYEPGDLPHSKNTKQMLTFDDDREIVNRAMRSVLDGSEDRYHVEYRMRRQDGSIVAVSESVMVCEQDKDGKPLRLGGLTQDLSRLKWAEEKARAMERDNKRLALQASESELADQNRLLRAANTASAMIIGGFHQDYETVLRQALQILGESVDADRAYIWRNQEVDGRLCCFQRSEWARQKHSRPVEKDVFLAYDDFMPNWREMIHEQMDIRARVKDLDAGLVAFPGMEDVLSIMLVPLFLNGEFWGFVGFDDCTNGHLFTAYEAEIMGSGAMVIASSISRNETFSKLNEARREAMESTHAKGEFLSRMSHEIRTPMNAIIGMTTIAQKTTDPAKIQYCLDKIDASSRQLLGIINDVLDMSKIDSGKFEIVPGAFDFEKMMQNVFNVVQVKLDEKHQDFHFDFGRVFTHKVVSDELRLSQVLINLLNNAVKFTPEGGRITLKVREEPIGQGNSRLRVEVVDTGIGIDPDQQKNLFQSFEQADGSISRQYGGTGLGLAICKKIVNLMGGDIWVESELGKGSRFIFEVEIGWGEEIPQAVAVKKPSKNMRILVVDDSEDVLEYFKNILGSFSLACDGASSGEKALEAVRASMDEGRPYDMIFVDWNMPGLNGGDTAREIRRLMNGDVVVVMISVADWSDIEQDAKSHGVTNFLSKPVLPSMLYNTIVQLTDNTLVTQSTEENRQVPDWHDKVILLAEDIDINREIIHSVLEETGVAIDDAENGAQAVEAFEKAPKRYDLILMDVQMPTMDGLAATRAIRELAAPQGQTVPIVAMTANAFKEDAQTCLDAGMNGHLAKPLDVDDLMKALADYFGTK